MIIYISILKKTNTNCNIVSLEPESVLSDPLVPASQNIVDSVWYLEPIDVYEYSKD